jgi:hypothetical protein
MAKLDQLFGLPCSPMLHCDFDMFLGHLPGLFRVLFGLLCVDGSLLSNNFSLSKKYKYCNYDCSAFWVED